MSEKFPAIRSILTRSDAYPSANGSRGFGIGRDELIALLGECTPRLDSISVIPTHDEYHDMTSFTITTYVSFARSELDDTDLAPVVLDGTLP